MNEAYHTTEQDAPAGEERAEMRDEIFERAGGMRATEARARRVFRHGPSATMVRQLLFWEGKECEDEEGYVYITYKQWWDEEGLSRTNVDTARLKLRDAGVLDEARRGVFNRLHYRLKLERLREVMFHELEDPPADDPVPENATLNQDFTVQGSDSLECRVPTVQSAGKRPPHYREDTEKTSEEVKSLSLFPFSDDAFFFEDVEDMLDDLNAEERGARFPTATSFPTQPTEERKEQASDGAVKDLSGGRATRKQHEADHSPLEAIQAADAAREAEEAEILKNYLRNNPLKSF